MDSLATADRVDGPDLTVREATPPGPIEPRQPLVRWHVVWSLLKQICPLLRFLFIFGGALWFGLPSLGRWAFGTVLIRPTVASVAGVLHLLGQEAAWPSQLGAASTLTVHTETAGLQVLSQCTPAESMTMWVVFLIALPMGWRARGILLPAGLAGLWALNTLRLASVLLLDNCARRGVGTVVHDYVWPWLTALIVIVGAWSFLARRAREDRHATRMRASASASRVDAYLK